MQNTNKIAYQVCSDTDVIADGVPVVVWAINDATAENVKLTNVDGAAGGVPFVLSLDFTATKKTISFPYGIQMRDGAGVFGVGATATVFYTKI